MLEQLCACGAWCRFAKGKLGDKKLTNTHGKVSLFQLVSTVCACIDIYIYIEYLLDDLQGSVALFASAEEASCILDPQKPQHWAAHKPSMLHEECAPSAHRTFLGGWGHWNRLNSNM